MRLSLKTRNRNEVNKRIYCAMVFACMFWFIGSLWGIDILSLHKEWKTNYKKKKSLSTTGLCKNTHHRFKLKLTEPRPLPPVTDSTATHHFNWPKKQRTLPSSNVFSIVVILNPGDKVVCSNRRNTGKLSPLTPNRAAAGQCLQETPVESETSGLHEILSGDTEQPACWAAEFLQMEWKKLWSKVSHGAHWGASPFRTRVYRGQRCQVLGGATWEHASILIRAPGGPMTGAGKDYTLWGPRSMMWPHKGQPSVWQTLGGKNKGHGKEQIMLG